MSTCFDEYRTPDGKKKALWGCAEWLYFLADVESHLTGSGRVFLRINRHASINKSGLPYYDADLHQSIVHGHLHGVAYLLDRKGLRQAIDKLSRVADSMKMTRQAR